MKLLLDGLVASSQALAAAAPWVLFGLALAGLLHVLLPQGLISRWLGRPGLSGVARGAWLGLPLPLCSCSVVPVTLELRRKGATRPASLSFLITTPESSVDSVILTWGLLGPVMAVARPVAAFFSAMLAGAVSIAIDDDEEKTRRTGATAEAAPPEAHDHDGHDHHHHHHDPHHGPHDHDHSHGLDDAADAEFAEGRRNLVAWLRSLPRRLAGPLRPEDPTLAPIWRRLGKPALRYGFVELADDVLFWLVLGVVAAGAMSILLPTGGPILGSGLLTMLVMLVVGIPMYICASASTPVAAALIAKGVSPGAALVLLLSGPATNLATIFTLGRHFGARFVRIYVGAVAVGALAAGLALDALVARFGWQIVSRLNPEAGDASKLELTCLVVLLALTAWRFRHGAARRGWSDVGTQVQALGTLMAPVPTVAEDGTPDPRGPWRRLAPRLAAGSAGLALVLWLGSGFVTVPPGSRGYGLLLGRLVARDLPPGLHWLPPWPVARFDVWRVDYPRKADLGFRSDFELIARRRELTLFADPRGWHSPVAAMNPQPEEAAYLTADENLLEMSFTVHYTVNDPSAFFYGTRKEVDLVALVAEATARELVATTAIDDLLTTARASFERTLAERLGERLAGLGVGVRVDTVRIVDLHPPAEAVAAFRDVSSAREERETRIHRAGELEAREVPRARGEAALLIARAGAEAEAARQLAAGRARGFLAQAGAYAGARAVLRHLLWIESAERALAGKEKLVVPPGTAPGSGVTLWRDREPNAPTSKNR
ncbi:MAG: SO_0444 family Cu/Zn efflux transporter [Thermoanaerobaculia bacterium]|nr:SO_0444 family Cu/Zn efflux transporter [Thermoanaerobaculia bacterium]